MDSVALASNIYLMFGTSKDQGDIIADSAFIVQQASLYKVSFAGNLYDTYYYSLSIPINIPKSLLINIRYLTLFAKSKEGVFSNKLYLQFKY